MEGLAMSTTNTTEDGEPWVYHGFPESNTTPIPDEFFDIIAPKLSEAELRVALYVMRRTRGFKKSEDAISFSQLVGGIKTRDGRILDQGTGMSKSAVWRGVNGLVRKGILLKLTALSPLGDNETNVYRIHYRGDAGVVLQKNHPGSPKEPPVVLQENTQETVLQETAVGYSNTAAQSLSIFPDGPDSKFRKGSHQDVLEDKQTTEAASQPVPATRERGPAAANLPPTPAATAQGMSRISDVLRTKQVLGAAATQAPGTRPLPDYRPPTVPGTNGCAPQPSHATGGEAGQAAASKRSNRAPRPSKPAAPSSSTEAPELDRASLGDRMDRVYEALQRAGIEAHRAPINDEPAPEPMAQEELLPPAADEDADPEYIDNIIRDISGELHDSKHTRSNVTQARRLWQASGMTVLDFKDALYDVRRVVRLQPGVENKMAYYFKCLKVVLGMERNPNPAPSRPPAIGAAGSFKQIEGGELRKSLAGRYAHLVQH
jgi:hypothetical protein